MLKEEKILGVKINTDLTKESVIDIIKDSFLVDGKTHYICTTNPEFIMDAQQDPDFKRIINNADLSVPDGIGLVLALRYKALVSKYNKESLLYPIRAFMTGLSIAINTFSDATIAKNRIDGVSLCDEICRLSAENSWSIFMLGGWPKDVWGRNINTNDDMAFLASSKIRIKYPNVNIIGASSRFSRNTSDDTKTIDYIRHCMLERGIERLDFLFVAYNHPYQEKWIKRNSSLIPCSVSIGVGATLDYFSGYKMKSPDIVTRLNIDWLFRLITQPWRIKRIFKAFPLFPLKVFIDSLSSNK